MQKRVFPDAVAVEKRASASGEKLRPGAAGLAGNRVCISFEAADKRSFMSRANYRSTIRFVSSQRRLPAGVFYSHDSQLAEAVASKSRLQREEACESRWHGRYIPASSRPLRTIMCGVSPPRRSIQRLIANGYIMYSICVASGLVI